MNEHYRCVVYPAYDNSNRVTGLEEKVQNGMRTVYEFRPHFIVAADIGDYGSMSHFVRSVRALVRLSKVVYDRTPPDGRESQLEMAHDVLSYNAALEVGDIINYDAEHSALIQPPSGTGNGTLPPNSGLGYLEGQFGCGSQPDVIARGHWKRALNGQNP
ncbi:hypothetical protein HYX09_02975 [Candidatus Woesearchaeota archaeon]|nr:hypothetical protein [Candidatus Woesearchaeota archaeon]